MAKELDLSKHTPEELAALELKLKEAKHEHKQRGIRAERKDRRDRAKASVRRPERRKGGRGVSVQPSNKPDEALAQMKRSFGDQWIDDPANPAVLLVQCEAQHCARLNVYHEGKWTSRRLGVDAVAAVVQLADGTQETRKFERTILNAEWRRS